MQASSSLGGAPLIPLIEADFDPENVLEQFPEDFKCPSCMMIQVDMLECPSHEYECNGVDCDVNLWFSLRFYETVRCQSRHTAPEAPAATSAAAEAAVARAALAPQRSHNGGRNERWVLVAHGRSRAPAHVDGIV